MGYATAATLRRRRLESAERAGDEAELRRMLRTAECVGAQDRWQSELRSAIGRVRVRRLAP